MLRETSNQESIAHALWEAHACIGQWAFCACLAMLRKALDLWSADYRDSHGMSFDKAGGERDVLYWRLKKIADENALYRDSLHRIIDGLRLSANDAVHDPTVCQGGQPGVRDAFAIEAIRTPYEQLHRAVADLIAATMPTVRIVYSDPARWRRDPPDAPRPGS